MTNDPYIDDDREILFVHACMPYYTIPYQTKLNRNPCCYAIKAILSPPQAATLKLAICLVDFFSKRLDFVGVIIIAVAVAVVVV